MRPRHGGPGMGGPRGGRFGMGGPDSRRPGMGGPGGGMHNAPRPNSGRTAGGFLGRTISNAVGGALSNAIYNAVHKVTNTVIDTSVEKYKATKEAELAQYKQEQEQALAEANKNVVRQDEMDKYPVECPNCAAPTDGGRYCKYCDGKLV